MLRQRTRVGSLRLCHSRRLCTLTARCQRTQARRRGGKKVILPWRGRKLNQFRRRPELRQQQRFLELLERNVRIFSQRARQQRLKLCQPHLEGPANRSGFAPFRGRSPAHARHAHEAKSSASRSMTACCRPPRRVLRRSPAHARLADPAWPAHARLWRHPWHLASPTLPRLAPAVAHPVRGLCAAQLIHRPQTRSRPLVYAASVQPRHLTPNIGRLPPFSRFREFSAIGKASHYESAATPTGRQAADGLPGSGASPSDTLDGPTVVCPTPSLRCRPGC